MKIIHTADWHLGQTFFGYDRKNEHIRFLQWLKSIIIDKNIDILLIAGDIFDSPNPSAESQKIYYRFLKEITDKKHDLQIIITAGNHDSAARLEAVNPLLENMNIAVRGVIKRTENGEIDYNHLIIPLQKGGYCLAVPYLRQGDFEGNDYSCGVKSIYDALCLKIPTNNFPIIAMGHLQTIGAEFSENEHSERLIIGGLESVQANAFSDRIAYTALGHIHRCQHVAHRQNIYYSGSPIPMSFAEKNNKQGVLQIEIENEKIDIQKIDYEDNVKLMTLLNGAYPLPEILSAIDNLPNGEITDKSIFLEIKVLIQEPEPSMRYRIEEALKGKSVRLTRIEAVAKQMENSIQNDFFVENLQKINPMEMAKNIFQKEYGSANMPDEMQQMLKEIIQEVEQ